jgi:hypothetical protein
MISTVAKAAVFGFLVPVFWTVVGFLFFTARESIWTNLYWKAVHGTCPLWVLNFPDGIDVIAQPLLNAMVYGGVLMLYCKVKEEVRKRKKPSRRT